MVKSKIHNLRGGMLAEAAAACALLFPLLLLIIFIAMEASYAYVIGRNMTNAASLAARGLAIYYQTNPEVVTDSSEQASIFSSIRIPNMVSGNNQFNIPSGSSGWNTAGSPPTVTVTCSYLSGQGSPALPSFPNPDPLNIGSTFTISGSATYRLQ